MKAHNLIATFSEGQNRNFFGPMDSPTMRGIDLYVPILAKKIDILMGSEGIQIKISAEYWLWKIPTCISNVDEIITMIKSAALQIKAQKFDVRANANEV